MAIVKDISFIYVGKQHRDKVLALVVAVAPIELNSKLVVFICTHKYDCCTHCKLFVYLQDYLKCRCYILHLSHQYASNHETRYNLDLFGPISEQYITYNVCGRACTHDHLIDTKAH